MDKINEQLKDQGLNEVYLNVIPDQMPPKGEPWESIENWGIRLATTYNPESDTWMDWTEEMAERLYHYLGSFDLIISYNWSNFDKQVISIGGNTERLSGFSVMDQVTSNIGQRIKLQNLSYYNGQDATRLDLGRLIEMDPDFESYQGYNRSKIKSLNHVINKALTDGNLNYWSCGNERKLENFDTSSWGQTLNDMRVPF